MKKLCLLLTLLAFTVALTSCKEKPVTRNRPIDEAKDPTDSLTMDHLQDPAVEVEPFEADEEAEIDAAQESKALSKLYHLLEQGTILEKYYAGDVAKVDDGFPQTLDGENYLIVIEGLKATYELEALWKSTFAPETLANDRYEELLNSHLYASINGALHIKEDVPLIPPLNNGSWSKEGGKLLSITEDKMVFQLEATLDGVTEDKELTLVKLENEWLLDSSYFLN